MIISLLYHRQVLVSFLDHGDHILQLCFTVLLNLRFQRLHVIYQRRDIILQVLPVFSVVFD